MKTLLLCLVALVAANAQPTDITGTWQGTLTVGQRVVFKLERKDGKLGAVLYRIDRNPEPTPAASATFQDSTLKLEVPAAGANYEGHLSADGNSIAGNVTIGPNSLPLNLIRATPDTAWVIPDAPAPVPSMAPTAVVHVEVATVRPSSSDARGSSYAFRAGQVQAFNFSLRGLVVLAYDVHERQISDLPGWAADARFEINIKPDTPGQPSLAQMKKLFQEVLVDRFQLKFHMEKRQLSVYAITPLTGKAHKLTKSASEGSLSKLLFTNVGLLPALNATMAELAQTMQAVVLDRPVIDRTGIAGRWDFTLDWMSDETQFGNLNPRPQQPDTGKPNIFQAFQEQLGLKLESVQAPADVLVVEKVERPSEN